MDYQKAYIYLFNAMTDALEELEGKSVENAASILREAQCQTFVPSAPPFSHAPSNAVGKHGPALGRLSFLRASFLSPTEREKMRYTMITSNSWQSALYK